MNPGYKTSHYPSEKDGVEVPTSHELFHNIQDAYNAGQWRTFTEGTAVWNELQVFPDSPGTWGDYLGFLPAFFREPERPFDQSMGSGGAATYSYGTAVWVEYPSERHGQGTIRQIWERLEQKEVSVVPHFLDATEEILRQHGTTLHDAWIEFSRWNLLTRERASLATNGNGYRRAAEYPSVRFETERQPSPTAAPAWPSMACRRAISGCVQRREPPSTPACRIRSVKRPPALSGLVVGAMAARALEPAQVQPLAPDRGVTLQSGESLLLVVTSAQRGAKARSIELALSTTPPTTDRPLR